MKVGHKVSLVNKRYLLRLPLYIVWSIRSPKYGVLPKAIVAWLVPTETGWKGRDVTRRGVAVRLEVWWETAFRFIHDCECVFVIGVGV